MKKVLLFLAIMPILFSCSAQVKPNTFPIADPDAIDYAIYTQEDGVSKKLPKTALKKHFAPKVVSTPILTVPTLTGNTQNLNSFLIDANQDGWYIDGSGKAKKFVNQIQTISLLNGVVTLSKGGGSFTIPLSNFTQGAGINITNGVISNTGDLSNTNEIQTLSLIDTILSLSKGGGSVNLSGLNKNIGNSDLTLSANRQLHGAGNNLKIDEVHNLDVACDNANETVNGAKTTTITNSYNLTSSNNFIQSGVSGNDLTTLGRNRIYGTDGNNITADNSENFISSIQGQNIITAGAGNFINTDTADNVVQTYSGDNIMQCTSGNNIIRNISSGDIIIQPLAIGSNLVINTDGTFDPTDKYLKAIDQQGRAVWSDPKPVSVTAPLTGDGTPLSPISITLPNFVDTNFGNTDILFSGDRSHDLNNRNLYFSNGNTLSLYTKNTIIAASQTLNLSGGTGINLNSLANKIKASGGANTFESQNGGRNIVKASTVDAFNIITTTVSPTKPIGAVLQKKTAQDIIEYTDYAFPASATATDNGKVLTYVDATKTMTLVAPGASVTKPFIKVSGGGGQQSIGSGVQEHIVNTVVQWDDQSNIWNATAGEYTFPAVGRYRVTVHFELHQVIAPTNGVGHFFVFGVSNVGVSNVNLGTFGNANIRIPTDETVYNFHYDNVVNITTPGNVYFYLQQLPFNGNGTYAHDKSGSSWIIIEKI